MKLDCNSISDSEFCDLVGAATTSIEERMNEKFSGGDFGGGIDQFTIAIYVSYFDSDTLLESLEENHGVGVCQDYKTGKNITYLCISVLVDPDLARNMSLEEFKSDVIGKVFNLFENFDMEVPESFRVSDLFLFLKNTFA